MSLQKKYYYTFKDLNTVINTVELWQNTTTTLTPELVYGAANAFNIEMPTISNKFQAVRGTGCECNIISYTGMEFLTGLYTTDMQNIMIKHYINGNLNWLGYLNSEMQTEPYNELNNYVVTFNGNDGFALMDKMFYCTGTGSVVGTTFNGTNIIDGAFYSGVTSQFNIIQTIFQKIGLPFVTLKICLSTTFTGYTVTTGQNILHQTYVDQSNYINEDSTPETLRKVLNSILEPYGAIIFQMGGNIIITDIHNLASNTSFTFQDYSMSGSTYTYTGTEAVTSNTKILQSIGYSGTGASVEISGGKNKQTVSYSPYILKDLLPTVLQSYSEFNCAIPSTWSTSYTSTHDTTLLHTYKTLTSHYNLTPYTGTTSGTGVTFEMGYDSTGSGSTWTPDSNGTQYYLRWLNNGSGAVNKICDIIAQPNLTITAMNTNNITHSSNNYVVNSGAGIKLTGKVWINDNSTTVWTQFGLRIDITIGGYKNIVTTAGSYYTYGFTSGTTSFYAQVYDDGSSKNINNRWMNFRSYATTSDITFPANVNLSGTANVAIYSDFWVNDSSHTNQTSNPASVTEVRLSNLSAQIVDISTYNTMVKSDVEYVGYLNTNFSNEADKVSLICGTAASPIDRGKLLYYNSGSSGSPYTPIYTWTRNGTTANIENLLINSLSSNFKTGYFTLNNLQLQNQFNYLNLLADSTYLSGKQFMITGYKVNYENATVECSAAEIAPDSNTIVSIVNQN